ncbi:MAG TPA: hypothetical protein VGF74_07355 [Thermoleophilaceae bacterium]
MKRTIASLAAIGVLAVPAAAGASHPRVHRAASGTGVAAKACKAERTSDGVAAFRQKYGNKKGRHAFARCVTQHVRQARKECRAERTTDGIAAFRMKYGNAKGRNAFSRCVRQHAGDTIS